MTRKFEPQQVKRLIDLILTFDSSLFKIINCKIKDELDEYNILFWGHLISEKEKKKRPKTFKIWN